MTEAAVTLKRESAREANSPGPDPGFWRPWKGFAKIRCGKCKTIHVLKDYHITPKGLVLPSLLCMVTACQWHARLTLKGWKQDG